MNTVTLDLEDDLVALLHQSNQPVRRAARELIVLELYRRGTLSSGADLVELIESSLAIIVAK